MPEPDDECLTREVVIDAADQAKVDLHEVGPQRDDVGEIGDTRAGIVDRQSHVRSEQRDRPRGPSRSP